MEIPLTVLNEHQVEDPKALEGLRAVFINMPLREAAKATAMPEGPLLMATNLRDNYGVDASVVDLNAYRIQDEVSERRGLPNGRYLTQKESFDFLKEHFHVHGTPHFVGLSGMITTLGAPDGVDVAKQQETAEMVRELAPDVLLVSGGGLATELKTGLFNYIPELDAVAHSEGDQVVVKICHDAAMIKRHGWKSALNQRKLEEFYLGESDGRHRLMYKGDRPRGDSKRLLPYFPHADLSLLERDVFGRSPRQMVMNTPAWHASAGTSSATARTVQELIPKANTVSSRGCPFGCFYCYRGAQGERDWRVRSAEDLYRQAMDYWERYGIRYIAYPDDNFAVTIDRIEEMVPLFKEIKDKGIRWGTHTRMDEGADPLRIIPMAKAGCDYIGFGPESANRDTLKVIGKGGHTLSMDYEWVRVDGIPWEFPRSMTMSMRNCLNYGIHANCTWIAFSPEETLDRLKDTVAYIRWQEQLYELHNRPAESVNKRMFSMTWYPGTELVKHPKVRSELKRVFNLDIDPLTGEPACNDAFYQYLLRLDDATKFLEGPSGEPLNFSEIPTDQCLKIRELIDSGRTLDILSL